jgi:hypothetical protein
VRSCERGRLRDLDGHNFEHVPLRRKGGGAPGLDLASERRRWGGVQGSCDAEGGCRMHGGWSTGPRTPAGLERSRRLGGCTGSTQPGPRPSSRTSRWEAEESFVPANTGASAVTHSTQFIDVQGEPTHERQNLSMVISRGHSLNETLTLRPGPVRLALEATRRFGCSRTCAWREEAAAARRG